MQDNFIAYDQVTHLRTLLFRQLNGANSVVWIVYLAIAAELAPTDGLRMLTLFRPRRL